MKLKHILFYVVIFISMSFGQNEGDNVKLFPPGNHFLPFRGNVKESKLAILYYPDNGSLKVDIGNSIDLLEIKYHASNSRLTFGIEFMAYAYSTNYEEQRLQIDAVDGFFGGNATFSKGDEKGRWFLRFRFIHNSAHLVDGNWWRSPYPRTWGKPGGPIPFTRDFAEVYFANEVAYLNMNWRYYSGIEYAIHLRPQDQKKLILNAGLEIHNNNLLGELWGAKTNLYGTYHFTLNGTDKYSGNSNFQAGIKLGDWNSKGVSFFFSYYNGFDHFSQYYNERISKPGFGFSVDF